MTSMGGTQDCQGCTECQTTYAGHPDNHKPLQPHTWGTMYNQHTGKPYKYCTVCQRIDDESYKLSGQQDEEVQRPAEPHPDNTTE